MKTTTKKHLTKTHRGRWWESLVWLIVFISIQDVEPRVNALVDGMVNVLIAEVQQTVSTTYADIDVEVPADYRMDELSAKIEKACHQCKETGVQIILNRKHAPPPASPRAPKPPPCIQPAV